MAKQRQQLSSSISTIVSFLLFVGIFYSWSVQAFISPRFPVQHAVEFRLAAEAGSGVDNDSNEIIAKRIVVEGDVQGGYYRSCVRNEVSPRIIEKQAKPIGTWKKAICPLYRMVLILNLNVEYFFSSLFRCPLSLLFL